MVPTLVDTKLVQAEIRADLKLSLIIKQLERDPEGVPKYSLEPQQLLYNNKLVLCQICNPPYFS